MRAIEASSQKGGIEYQWQEKEYGKHVAIAAEECHLVERERRDDQKHGAHSPHHYVATAAIVPQSGNHASSDLVLAVAVEAVGPYVMERTVNPFFFF